MSIENEIFKRTHVDLEKLKKYGFLEENNEYKYSCKFLNDNFEVNIIVNKNGEVSGKIYDTETAEEYTNIRLENSVGEFVNSVKTEYKNILQDIKEKCFEENYFLFEQANRITKYIINKYKVKPEFLWENSKNHGVFRNKNNNKWFGIIMTVDKSKYFNDSGDLEIMNVKVSEKKFNELLDRKGYYKAYHMNKKNWVTFTLDDTIKDEELYELIDSSYDLINSSEIWIVPANPKFYDIMDHFNKTDIVEWKQSSDVHVGDSVYIYVGSPYSAILYKCQVLEVNIPYEYQDDNLKMNYVMKLKLLKKYKEDEITFKRLNKLGINAIRGPRKVSEQIAKDF